MRTADFDYFLPPDLIAQEALPCRDMSRMMVLLPHKGLLEHSSIRDIERWLRNGDVIVANNSKVIPARIFGKKEGSGGKVELLLIEEKNEVWEAFCHLSGKPKIGMAIIFDEGKWIGKIVDDLGGGKIRIFFQGWGSFSDFISKNGYVPLPPYIKRKNLRPAVSSEDRCCYQTVYAKHEGSIAAPTAGLHFTEEIIDRIKEKGIVWCEVTLHVGPGTFKPVTSDNIEDHQMESERYTIDTNTADELNNALQAQKRILTVGSTTVRVLESVATRYGRIIATSDRTSLFITPGYKFRIVDALLTNFHMPKSTLIIMLSAFAGRDNVMRAYEEAVRERYRFLSFGDAMFVY